MSVDVTTEITIRCPVAEVFAFSADPDNGPFWHEHIESVEWETEPGVRVGSRAAFVAHFLGRRMAYTYEIAELVSMERLVMRTAEGPFPMQTTYRWEATEDESTRMTIRNMGSPSGFSRLVTPFMKYAIRRASRKDLAMLKRLLESDGQRERQSGNRG